MKEEFWIIVLGAIALFFFAQLVLLKAECRDMSKQISEDPAGRRLTVRYVDRGLTSVASQINDVISAQEDSNSRIRDEEAELRDNIASISHDLRTPLTSIRGYLQLLEETKLDAGQSECVEVIHTKIELLNELIDDFYCYSYWNSYNQEPQIERIGLSKILSETLLGFVAAFEERKMEPELRRISGQAIGLEDGCESIESEEDEDRQDRRDQQSEPLFVAAEPEMLRRVLQNLVANALRHGSKYLLVEYGATPRWICENENESENECEEDFALVIFENGVTDGYLVDASRVFDRFYSGDPSRSGRHSGLGLATAKLLVEKMGGTISAESGERWFRVMMKLRQFPEQVS